MGFQETDMLGLDRFKVLRKLGSGGMGVVYEALDTELGAKVALKTLLTGDRKELLRLRREFRALHDIHHRNLVTLYELLQIRDGLVIVMELVQGTDLLGWVAGGQISRADVVGPADTVDATFAEEPTAPDTRGPRAWTFDEARLTSALGQLTDALETLHAHGLIHRDVKPSNVLVEPEGRLVLLDFGLVRAIPSVYESILGQATTEGDIVGTIAYMAPEALSHTALGPASDWYSVGVLLYECLTGQYPYQGSAWQILAAKRKDQPPDPRSLNPACPELLAQLAISLLNPSPRERADGRAIRRVLSQLERSRPHTLALEAASTPPEIFVGRERERESLLQAWQRASQGRPSVTWIQGESGVGKTALVRQFLHHLRAEGRQAPFVAWGRCHERENVPYKVFAALADRLGLLLSRLGDEERRWVVPKNMAALSRIFPTLARQAPARAATEPEQEPMAERSLAFEAFSSLLVGLARLRGLVVTLDDVQWADEESVSLLSAVLDRLAVEVDCPLLLILCRRAGVDNPALDAVLHRARERGLAKSISLHPLQEDEIRRLVEHLAPETGASADLSLEWGRRVHEESGGNPFLASEIVRYLRWLDESGREPESSTFKLADALAVRVAHLTPLARQALQACCLAGRAVPQELLAEACGQDWRSEEWRDAVFELSAEKFIARAAFKPGQLIEPYHDRLREEIVRSLPAREARALHEALAAVFDRKIGQYAEAAADHWRQVGRVDRARDLYLQAARRAEENLAFIRAAHLYALAAEMEEDESERSQISLRRAEALANAGLCEEAAQACETVLRQGASGATRLRARFLHAEQLLKAGLVARGLASAEELFHSIGERPPTSRLGLTLAVLWRRALLGVGDLDGPLGDPVQVSPTDRTLLETLWGFALGFSMVDPILAGYFHARLLRIARNLGDEESLARGLLLEAAIGAGRGSAHLPRSRQLLLEAEAIARRRADHKLLAQVTLARGISYFFVGEWTRVLEDLNAALETFRTRCYGVTWEIATAISYLAFTLRRTGRFRDAMALAEEVSSDELLAGNKFLNTNLRTMSAILWLARGDVEATREHLDHVLDTWPQDRFTIQHFYHLYGQCELAFYEDRPEDVWRILETQFRFVRRAALFRFFTMRTEYARLRGRAALALAARSQGRAKTRFLKAVTKAVSALQRERVPFASAWARHLEAGQAHVAGEDPGRVASLFQQAAAELEASGLELHRLAAKARAARVLGDRAAEDEALAAIRAEGVEAPERLLRIWSPGFEEP